MKPQNNVFNLLVYTTKKTDINGKRCNDAI